MAIAGDPATKTTPAMSMRRQTRAIENLSDDIGMAPSSRLMALQARARISTDPSLALRCPESCPEALPAACRSLVVRRPSCKSVLARISPRGNGRRDRAASTPPIATHRERPEISGPTRSLAGTAEAAGVALARRLDVPKDGKRTSTRPVFELAAPPQRTGLMGAGRSGQALIVIAPGPDAAAPR